MAGPGTKTDEGDSALDSGDTHAHDVLCGRGGQSNNHPGNEWFRRLVRSNRALYRSCPKHTKLLVAKAIVQAVQQQDPPGRFIKLKGSENGSKDIVWVPITYTQAVNKTSQALREKESRDSNKNKKKQQEPQQKQTAQQESVPEETHQTKNVEIGKEAAKRVKDDGLQTPDNIANLTNVAIQSAGLLEKSASSKNKNKCQRRQLSNIKMSSRGQVGDQQKKSTEKNPQCVGQKRKNMDSFVKPSWWRMGSPQNGMNAVSNTTGGSSSIEASGTIVTPSTEINSNSEDSNKRMKVLKGVGNAHTNRTGGHERNNMGRGVVNQVKKPASPTQRPIDETPFPMETTLVSRQSTLFRFLNNTGIFGRGTSVDLAPPTGVTNPSSATNTASFDAGVNVDQIRLQNDVDTSQNSLQSTSWPQQVASDRISNLQYHQEQRTSRQFFSSDQHMGKTSVQQLRSQQLQQQQSLIASGFENGNNIVNSIAGLEEEMEEIPTSGLMMPSGHNRTDGGHDAAPLPPPKGLKTQMSDWLTSFFPSPTKGDGSMDNYNRTNNNIFDSSSHSGIDNEGTTIPPPPGGGAGLGRSVSSAIFDLVESPSLLLTTLKSGMTSLFGDSVLPPAPGVLSTPTRRFPSSFQQQIRQQQQQNVLQQHFLGKASAGGTMVGNHPVLGERAKRRGSLLEDFEETPMEKELRNAKPEEQQRGARSLLDNAVRNGSDCMPFTELTR